MTKERRDVYLCDRLDWNLLRTFLAIAHEKSVSRAATRLHLTQSAVSQALRRLEEQLSLRLVDRHGPRIEVTPAGVDVQKVAEQIYGAISQLVLTTTGEQNDISGTVRIATVSGISFPAYDDFLVQFHRSYPRIEFESQEMRSADVINALQQKTMTVGLTPQRKLPKGVDARLFLRQRYALFCGQNHPLFGQEGLTISDIEGERFVSFSGDKVGDNLSPLTIFRDEKGFTGKVIASSSSMSEVKRFIWAGVGIGCLPSHLVRDEVEKRRFQQLPPGDGVADLDISLVWAQDRKLTVAEAAFFDALNHFLDGEAGTGAGVEAAGAYGVEPTGAV